MLTFFLSLPHSALYPPAVRVKREMASMVNPTFQNAIEDVNVLFEVRHFSLDICLLTSDLSNHMGHVCPEDFGCTVLTTGRVLSQLVQIHDPPLPQGACVAQSSGVECFNSSITETENRL
uniref:Uncharacterized protein n=1 Tax=Oncorhynchus kisutch TaxID=8019 RepID=A0A8C7JH32_ONCKI